MHHRGRPERARRTIARADADPSHRVDSAHWRGPSRILASANSHATRPDLKEQFSMSSDFLLERTRQADLQPLVANGVPVFRSYGQIRVELLNSLSQEHLDLFADPNADPATGDIQWYS